MSAKVLHSFRDENRDLHKQLGCMSGIFQLFDRRHFLSGRSLNGDSQKRLPPAENGNKEAEPKSRAQQKATEKSRKNSIKGKRISTESSTTTVSSSSCSSSFSSSLEFNKATHQEPSSSGQTIYADKHRRDLSMRQPNASKSLSQQSFDSTYRETRGIPVRPGGKDGVGHILKYIDSPRPSQPLKPIKPRVSGVNESFQVHGKLREAHRNSNEERDGGMRFAPKEARRLSYDERASRDAQKSATKPKELPRLSLDSKVRSIRRGCSAETRSNHFLKDLQKENENNDTMLDLQPEPGSVKRPSNVVAKLMGLDLSDSVSTSVTPLRLINTCPSDRSDPLSRSSRTIDETKQGVLSKFPRNTQGFNSPQRSSNSIMKPTSNTKFPLETAPWRQSHGSKGSPRSTFKCEEETPKSPKPSPSVYGLMEKRLADLEFRKSGKDLRALKQILEAMQKSQETLDNKKDQASNLASQVNNIAFSETIAIKRDIKGGTMLPATPMASKPQKSCKSPIIIRRPGKLVDKTYTSASTVSSNNASCLQKLQTTTPVDNRKELLDRRTAKDQTPRNIYTTDVSNVRLRSTDKNSDTRKSTQKWKVPQSDENYIGPRELTGITSPRLQHRRFGLEKQSFTAPPSDSSRTRRQRGRQSLEASTPSRKLGTKSPSSRQSNSKLIETSTSTRSMSHQDDTTSQQSESNSYTDSEVTSIHQSDTIEGSYFKQHSQKLQSPAVGLSKEKSLAEPGKATLEQPSPVSVLDSTFYRDDSPSPVKKISNAFKDDDDGENLDEAKYDPRDLVLSSCSTMPSLGTEIDQNRLENLKHLIQNHRQMSSKHEESISGHIALLCDHSNPDHMYISDILLASGILRFLESSWTAIEFHTLQQLINQDLFLALEDIREDNEAFDGEMQCTKRLRHKNEEKVQRRLVFDVVNEFLVQKLVENSFKQWSSPNKLTESKPIGQQLLKELFSQVDQLQRTNLNGDLDDEDENLTSMLLENFMDQSQNWTECDGETPGIVLDVERLIFKDLITELVSGDSVDHAGWSGGHCRQLFSK